MRINSYKIIDHPSDTGISACAETLEGLFEICAVAMFSIICNIDSVKQAGTKKIKIQEKTTLDPDYMLISWLERLIYIHETEKMLFSGFKIKKLQTGKCAGADTGHSIILAEASGQKIDFRRHEIFVSIKAPTYHMLKVEHDIKAGRWIANVIFDV